MVALFGKDLFGEDVVSPSRGPVADKFMFAPFTILDAKQGEWQKRKRAWLAMGIVGELGREAETYNTMQWLRDKNNKGQKIGGAIDTGTSIFDPVLTEMAYRWWCPAGGQIVDPFAGGSVRGIVASALDRKYWGCDLSGRQIKANYQQANDVLGATVPVKVSAAMLRQSFHPCDKEYVAETCRGRCCEAIKGIKVTIHPLEATKFPSVNGLLTSTEEGLCPYKSDDGRCNVHEDKPFGCRASPFTLNNKDTLIIRNRYRRLKCYSDEGSIPAYHAHSWSLVQIFGDAEANRLITHLDAGGDDLICNMPAMNHTMLRDNDNAKGSDVSGGVCPVWVHGDSMETLASAPKADFIFSCPPYGDLEKYSDDPADLSQMEWHAFSAAYKRIIMRSLERLNDDRFACFVVGDFRDKRGYYRDFVSLTISAFKECGAGLYNDAILATSIGSAAMRVTKQFESGRKLAKVHQNILVFCKGDWRKAAMACNKGV